MARKALSAAQLAVVQAVSASIEEAIDAGGAVGHDGRSLPLSGVVVAVSGGADSLALAAGAAVAADRLGLSCRAVTIDHRLQPGSSDVASEAVRQVSRWGIEGEVVAVEVDGPGGMEAAARDARYRALEAAAGDGEVIMVGHTLDDQAESVLLGLVRGSGIRSLSGMSPRRGRILRPLLGLRRADVAEAATEWGASPHLDPHNAQHRFSRVRVREEVLPLMERSLGPGVAEALARTARLARTDADHLDELAAAIADPADCAQLAAAPPAIRNRAIKSWLAGQGATDLQSVHVEAVADLVMRWRGQRGVDIPGVHVTRRDSRLHAVDRSPT